MRLTDDDLGVLRSYDRPGNIRELQNVIERAVILAKAPRLRLDLALAHTESWNSTDASAAETGKEDKTEPKIMRSDELTRIESENILTALEHARWKISGSGGAAELLGINPNTLAS
jgi:transcriptional regulator with GAF, ATPase, and Fis domain